MSEEFVHLEIAGGVATITLDSPANRNALSRALMGGLETSLATSLNTSATVGPDWLRRKMGRNWSLT